MSNHENRLSGKLWVSWWNHKEAFLWGAELLMISQWVCRPKEKKKSPDSVVTNQQAIPIWKNFFENLATWTDFFYNGVSLSMLCVVRDWEPQQHWIATECFIIFCTSQGWQWHWFVLGSSEWLSNPQQHIVMTSLMALNKRAQIKQSYHGRLRKDDSATSLGTVVLELDRM